MAQKKRHTKLPEQPGSFHTPLGGLAPPAREQAQGPWPDILLHASGQHEPEDLPGEAVQRERAHGAFGSLACRDQMEVAPLRSERAVPPDHGAPMSGTLALTLAITLALTLALTLVLALANGSRSRHDARGQGAACCAGEALPDVQPQASSGVLAQRIRHTQAMTKP